MALVIKGIVEINLIRVRQHCISHYLTIRQLYASNKMEHFSYIGGCSVYEYECIKVFKRIAIFGYKRFQVVNNIILFKTVIPLSN